MKVVDVIDGDSYRELKAAAERLLAAADCAWVKAKFEYDDGLRDEIVRPDECWVEFEALREAAAELREVANRGTKPS